MSSMLDLQRLVGNRTVQAVVTRPATPRKSQHGSLQRLWTAEEFKKQTDAGLLTGRGKTMKKLDSLLVEYHGIREKGMHLQPGSTQDRAINILHEIREDVNLWMDTHEGDKSRSRKRVPGMTKLFIETGKELAELTKIRDAAREFLGEDQAPVERTENTFKTKMEGDVSSILSKVGPIIGAAAPSSGDSAEIENRGESPG